MKQEGLNGREEIRENSKTKKRLIVAGIIWRISGRRSGLTQAALTIPHETIARIFCSCV